AIADARSGRGAANRGHVPLGGRRHAHAALRVLLREVPEGSVDDVVDGRARARRVPVPWLREQDIAAPDGRVLLQDLAQGLIGGRTIRPLQPVANPISEFLHTLGGAIGLEDGWRSAG